MQRVALFETNLWFLINRRRYPTRLKTSCFRLLLTSRIHHHITLALAHIFYRYAQIIPTKPNKGNITDISHLFEA
uniref:Ovule protein n=1 Tax=Ascaris lumbricoides TaxID=6252 RepID=A0A0M3I0Z6_ASCLU